MAVPHITVCICTYKRPHYLENLLAALAVQETKEGFTFSVVVADNDLARSGEAVVRRFLSNHHLEVTYCVQPKQNIALTRNVALENATGDFVAFIDDDEEPIRNWLLLLYQACQRYEVDGVIGSVLPKFEMPPPAWVVKGRFCERRTYQTGHQIQWPQGRTGNLLFRRSILQDLGEPIFRPEFLTAEDQDFFRRLIEQGRRFVWCAEAIAYELVPPIRWKRGFMLKRALLRGKVSLHHPTSRVASVAKSLVALPLYLLALPFLLLFGQHVFYSYLVRAFDHIGKILALVRISPVRQSYVTE